MRNGWIELEHHDGGSDPRAGSAWLCEHRDVALRPWHKHVSALVFIYSSFGAKRLGLTPECPDEGVPVE